MSQRLYRPVSAQLDLPAMDADIIALWREASVFAKSLDATKDGPRWTFFEGPPTANGRPAPTTSRPASSRTSSRASRPCRATTWTAGPAGTATACRWSWPWRRSSASPASGTSRRTASRAFNEKCRESVRRHVGAFSELTERMGYWVDLDEAYWTMDSSYVESVWWSLKQIFDKGLLVQDHRVAPYCPRCGTGLSDHELAQGYETVVDPSVYVRFPLTSGPLAGNASLLVWTTTPWTLVSNTAVAVHPDVTYVVATDGVERLVVAEPLLAKALGEGWTATGESFQGREMERWSYQRPFDLVDRRGRALRRARRPTSPPRTAPVWCTSPRRSAPTTSRRAGPTACRW